MAESVADTAVQTDSIACLQGQLAQFKRAGGSQFAPVKLCLIESLLRKADSLGGMAADLLQQRATRLLTALQSEFELAQAQARSTGKALIARQPQTNPELVRLFRAGEFRSIQRLSRHHARTAESGPLQQLLQTLNPETRLLTEAADPQSFDEVMRRQELGALQTDGLASLTSHLKSRVDADELRSMRHFREVLARRTINKAVQTAMEEVPENAGPLNAHLLVVKAITTLQDIAPYYLNRFVSHIDSLLWLEQASAQFPPSEPAKSDSKNKPRKGTGKGKSS